MRFGSFVPVLGGPVPVVAYLASLDWIVGIRAIVGAILFLHASRLSVARRVGGGTGGNQAWLIFRQAKEPGAWLSSSTTEGIAVDIVYGWNSTPDLLPHPAVRI